VQQQKQFTADASHEIRTPLSAIRGNLEVLLRKQREPIQYEEKIKEVIGQADRLNLLLDQLLQLARLEAGTTKKESVSLTDIVEDTTEKWKKQIVEKKIIFHSAIPKDTMVVADRFFMAMIINNLIDNAIKYSPDYGKVFCSWDKPTNCFSITNEGPGITGNQIPQVFNRFYRSDESRSSQIPGSGLGLAIVKKLSDLQRVVISVQSIPGNTIFTLQFPA
jgi:signal transduction histidine kinase